MKETCSDCGYNKEAFDKESEACTVCGQISESECGDDNEKTTDEGACDEYGICRHCGAKLNGRFCGNCGFDNAADSNICPVCNYIIPYNSKYCPNCGFKKRSTSDAQKNQSGNKVKKKNILIAKISVAAGVLLIGVIVLLSLFHTRIQPFWVNRIEIGDTLFTVEQTLGKADDNDSSTYYWYEKGVDNSDAVEYDLTGKSYRYVRAEFDSRNKLEYIALVMDSQKENYECKKLTLSNDELVGNNMSQLRFIAYTAKMTDKSIVKSYLKRALITEFPATDRKGKTDMSFKDDFCEYTATIRVKETSVTPYLRINAEGMANASGKYILFGEYPQSIKEESVTVGETADSRGYYLGSDGYYYAKVVAAEYRENGYKFNEGEAVGSGETYYFKVEPIKWRILSENDGNALILCESIIDNRIYAESSNNYAESEIRAWLNNEFYNTAFSNMQKALIQTTEVDNGVKSTGYKNNPYACENTNDKIFLPSYKDIVNAGYGFSDEYIDSDSAREIRTSDYSLKRGGLLMSTDLLFYDGYWWLRSPYYGDSTNARFVGSDGRVYHGNYVFAAFNGVVPALTISLF